MRYDWLPELKLRSDYLSEEDYINALYEDFKRDFLDKERKFKGLPIRIKRHPPYNGIFSGKEATFRHLITEGHDENNRIISPSRCKRIGWILPVIENYETKEVHCWKNYRKSNGYAYILSLSNFSYKVVLTKRSDYLLLWTHFPLTYGHEREKLRKDWEKNQIIS